jgi:secreted trypsin-like serine protease
MRSRKKPTSPVFLQSQMRAVALSLGLLALVALCAAAPDKRIVGGAPVSSASQYPYMVTLHDSQTGTFLCGGTLISPGWVLTAGSCVRTLGATANTDRNVNVLRVLLGSVQLTHPARIAAVSRAVIHPSWSFSVPQAQRVNLAWLNLALAVPYSSVMRPVQLVTPDEAALFASPGVGTGVAAGWGSTEAGVFPDTLQSAPSNVVAAATCNAALASSGQLPLSDGELCATAAPCTGDVGGPLVVTQPSTGATRQVGIVSRTTVTNGTCTTDGSQYAIYTAVAPNRDFIQLNMNEPLYVGSGAAALLACASLALLAIVI